MTTTDIYTTNDHQEIKSWIENSGGVPARLAYDSTAINSDPLTVWFRNEPADVKQNYQELDWDEFFSVFDHYGMSFEYNNEKGNDRYFAFKNKED